MQNRTLTRVKLQYIHYNLNYLYISWKGIDTYVTIIHAFKRLTPLLVDSPV